MFIYFCKPVLRSAAATQFPAAQSQLRQQQYEPVEINNVKDRGQLASLSDLTQALLAMWVTGVESPERGVKPGPAPSEVGAPLRQNLPRLMPVALRGDAT